LMQRQGVSGAMKESVSRAFGYPSAHRTPFGVRRALDMHDFHVEVIDHLIQLVGAAGFEPAIPAV